MTYEEKQAICLRLYSMLELTRENLESSDDDYSRGIAQGKILGLLGALKCLEDSRVGLLVTEDC